MLALDDMESTRKVGKSLFQWLNLVAQFVKTLSKLGRQAWLMLLVTLVI